MILEKKINKENTTNKHQPLALNILQGIQVKKMQSLKLIENFQSEINLFIKVIFKTDSIFVFIIENPNQRYNKEI